MPTVRDPRRSHDLYRFYDANDRLLYIGISLNAAHRASSHRKEKEWWPDVARMDVEHLGDTTRQEAEQTELAAIRSECPLYNVVGNGAGEKIVSTLHQRWTPDDRLDGLFCLSPDLEHGFPLAHYQGQVLSEPVHQTFMVQLFSWWDGRPTNRQLFAIEDMLDWKFFDSEDEWHNAGDTAMAARDRMRDRQDKQEAGNR